MAKRRKKLTDKQLIMMSLGFSAIFICGLMIFSFKDKIFEEPVEDVNWGEVAPEGVVDFEDTSTPEETIDITSNKGLIYERKNFYNLGISLYLPQDWDVNIVNSSNIYFTTKDSDYPAVEISIATKPLEKKHPDNLAFNMLNFVRHNFEYHVKDFTFYANTYAINSEFLQEVYDTNQKVWADISNPSHYQQVEEVVDASTGTWVLKDKFLGVSEHGKIKMFTNDGRNAEAIPYYRFFYTYIDDTEYFVSVLSPSDYSSTCNEIADFIFTSIQPLEPVDNIYLPSFDKTKKLEDISFKYPDTMTLVSDANTLFRSEFKNIDSDDFGIGISSFVIDFKEKEYIVKDFNALSTYKKQLFAAYTNLKMGTLITDNLNEIVLAYNSPEDIVIDGKTCQKYDTQLYLRTTGTEIDSKAQQSFPSYGITYMIEKDAKIYIISVTYGEGNQAIAEKYARALTKTIKIN